MNTSIRVCVIFVCGMTFLGLLNAADPQQSHTNTSVAQLLQRIDRLEARIEALEKQSVRPLTPAPLARPAAPIPRTNPYSGAAPVPPPRKPSGRINGVPYYVIPVSGEAATVGP